MQYLRKICASNNPPDIFNFNDFTDINVLLNTFSWDKLYLRKHLEQYDIIFDENSPYEDLLFTYKLYACTPKIRNFQYAPYIYRVSPDSSVRGLKRNFPVLPIKKVAQNITTFAQKCKSSFPLMPFFCDNSLFVMTDEILSTLNPPERHNFLKNLKPFLAKEKYSLLQKKHFINSYFIKYRKISFFGEMWQEMNFLKKSFFFHLGN